LSRGQELAVLEQVEIHRQTLLVQTVGGAVGLLDPHVTVDPGVPVRISERQLVPVLIRELDQFGDHQCELALLLPQCHIPDPCVSLTYISALNRSRPSAILIFSSRSLASSSA